MIGLVNAFGNLGGFAGPYIAGWLKQEYQSLPVAFDVLGAGLLVGAGAGFSAPEGSLPAASLSSLKSVLSLRLDRIAPIILTERMSMVRTCYCPR